MEGWEGVRVERAVATVEEAREPGRQLTRLLES